LASSDTSEADTYINLDDLNSSKLSQEIDEKFANLSNLKKLDRRMSYRMRSSNRL